jgi:hypothetical protein
MIETRKLAARGGPRKGAGGGAMLVACRLAGLSTLEADYADINAHAPSAKAGEKSRDLAN